MSAPVARHLLTFAALAAIAVTAAHAGKGQCKGGGFQKCFDESGLSADEWKTIKTEKTLPDKPEVKKFLCCTFKKFKKIDENGEMDPEKCKEGVKKHAAKIEGAGIKAEDLEQCCEQGGSDCEERAYNMVKCGLEKTGLSIEMLMRGGRRGGGKGGKGRKRQEGGGDDEE